MKPIRGYELEHVRDARSDERDGNDPSRAPAVQKRFPAVNRLLAIQGSLDFGDGTQPYATRSRLRPPSGPKTQNGLTLVEVMIVAVIVAILALIAYPSYEGQLRKGHRAAAQNFMMEVANRQQRYLLDARGYAVGAGAIGTLNMTVPGEVSRFYTLTIDPAAPTIPPSFTIVATPIAGSRQVADGALTLDHQGAKTRNSQTGW